MSAGGPSIASEPRADHHLARSRAAQWKGTSELDALRSPRLDVDLETRRIEGNTDRWVNVKGSPGCQERTRRNEQLDRTVRGPTSMTRGDSKYGEKLIPRLARSRRITKTPLPRADAVAR